MEDPSLQVKRFTIDAFPDLENLAEQLTVLKALASRTPTSVTENQLKKIAAASDVCNLFIQLDGDNIVGWCMITISILEDRGHLGPIAVIKEGSHIGSGSQLMQYSLDYVWSHNSDIRRIDLSNRPSHDLEKWYRKFGFVPRNESEGDPTTIYRMQRP